MYQSLGTNDIIKLSVNTIILIIGIYVHHVVCTYILHDAKTKFQKMFSTEKKPQAYLDISEMKCSLYLLDTLHITM